MFRRQPLKVLAQKLPKVLVNITIDYLDLKSQARLFNGYTNQASVDKDLLEKTLLKNLTMILVSINSEAINHPTFANKKYITILSENADLFEKIILDALASIQNTPHIEDIISHFSQAYPKRAADIAQKIGTTFYEKHFINTEIIKFLLENQPPVNSCIAKKTVGFHECMDAWGIDPPHYLFIKQYSYLLAVIYLDPKLTETLLEYYPNQIDVMLNGMYELEKLKNDHPIDDFNPPFNQEKDFPAIIKTVEDTIIAFSNKTVLLSKGNKHKLMGRIVNEIENLNSVEDLINIFNQHKESSFVTNKRHMVYDQFFKPNAYTQSSIDLINVAQKQGMRILNDNSLPSLATIEKLLAADIFSEVHLTKGVQPNTNLERILAMAKSIREQEIERSPQGLGV